MGVLLGYVWTEAVTVKIFTRFQMYTGTCGRGLNLQIPVQTRPTLFFDTLYRNTLHYIYNCIVTLSININIFVVKGYTLPNYDCIRSRFLNPCLLLIVFLLYVPSKKEVRLAW